MLTTATEAPGWPGSTRSAGPPRESWPRSAGRCSTARRLPSGPDASWPLPALPAEVGGAGRAGHPRHRPHRAPWTSPTVVLRPPTLVVGVGASRGVSAAEVLGLIGAALADAAGSPRGPCHARHGGGEGRRDGLAGGGRGLGGWPLVAYPADALAAAVAVPNPSEVVAAAVATPSVAEAAALIGGDVTAGAQAQARQGDGRSGPASAQRGRLAVVGLGPGDRELLTPRAAPNCAGPRSSSASTSTSTRSADLLRPGTRVVATGLGAEEERARAAVDAARGGHAVALIGCGDAGVYAMAQPRARAVAAARHRRRRRARRHGGAGRGRAARRAARARPRA